MLDTITTLAATNSCQLVYRRVLLVLLHLNRCLEEWGPSQTAQAERQPLHPRTRASLRDDYTGGASPATNNRISCSPRRFILFMSRLTMRIQRHVKTPTTSSATLMVRARDRGHRERRADPVDCLTGGYMRAVARGGWSMLRETARTKRYKFISPRGPVPLSVSKGNTPSTQTD